MLDWHISSFSGGSNCVEVVFTTSSYSGSSACVEVGKCDCEMVLIRDSKVSKRIGDKAPVLKFTKNEWEAFVLGVKNNEFNIS